MPRRIKYNVVIHIGGNPQMASPIGQKSVPYYSGRGNTDTIRFLKRKIVLEMYRNTVCSLASIVGSSNNTINSQIIKALILYYLNVSNFPIIRSIDIAISSAKHPSIARYTIPNGQMQIIQVIRAKNVNRPNNMHMMPPSYIFDETKLGNKARIAVSSWLLAMSTSERHLKFTRLWIAFNALFAYFGNKKAEYQNLYYMRQQIEGNIALFPQTLNIVLPYNYNSLRNSFRWKIFCRNEFSRHAQRFFDCIQSYQDSRIMNLFHDVLSSETITDIVGHHPSYANTMHHVTTVSASKDIELVTLLGVKYAYFLRNQRQHGLTIDPAFIIHETTVDAEVDKINELLTMLLFELISQANAIPVQP